MIDESTLVRCGMLLHVVHDSVSVHVVLYYLYLLYYLSNCFFCYMFFFYFYFFFFFQAEDGIRDIGVTGVQTCALPISACGNAAARRAGRRGGGFVRRDARQDLRRAGRYLGFIFNRIGFIGEPTNPTRRYMACARSFCRSEERRVGEECRSRWRRVR